jgi:hypothetical protein
MVARSMRNFFPTSTSLVHSSSERPYRMIATLFHTDLVSKPHWLPCGCRESPRQRYRDGAAAQAHSSSRSAVDTIFVGDHADDRVARDRVRRPSRGEELRSVAESTWGAGSPSVLVGHEPHRRERAGANVKLPCTDMRMRRPRASRASDRLFGVFTVGRRRWSVSCRRAARTSAGAASSGSPAG